jgi:lipopolysaccharide/colanic/teichoic acid biosynthesis glycosyltransferase
MKRIFDICFSLGGIIVLSPFFIVFGLLIRLESKGNILFRQKRVGKGNRDFLLYKFRSMYTDAEAKGQLTIGGRDPRITQVGFYLRKFKLDELPQLFNVLKGDMSLVGPRPEVRKYVDLYTPEQQKVLSVRPGITDYASIMYFNENDLLGKSVNPEQDYINIIMPEKLRINLDYIRDNSLFKDLKIILRTVLKVVYH